MCGSGHTRASGRRRQQPGYTELALDLSLPVSYCMMNHDDPNPIRRLSPAEVATRIARSSTDGPVALVDVREPHEFGGGHLAGSLHIPLGTLERRLDEIPRDRPVVFVCRSGGRSMTACRLARAAGIANPGNLEGGLRAWAREIDPSLLVL